MKKITTPEFRVSFPHIFKPQSFAGSAPKYSILMLFPKSTDISGLKNLLTETMQEKWPDKTSRPKKIHSPIKDGDTDLMEDGTLRCEKYPEMKGHWLIRAASNQPIGLVDKDLSRILDENDFYAGCYARATLHAFAYAPSKDRPQSKCGVGFGLNNIQKLREGDTFTGRTNPEDDFEAVETPKNEPNIENMDNFLA